MALVNYGRSGRYNMQVCCFRESFQSTGMQYQLTPSCHHYQENSINFFTSVLYLYDQ